MDRVNAYTLTFAVLLMTAAALGDRLGRRRVFAVGLAIFAAASAGCALAPDAGVLIAARAVQGAGAAAIMPMALVLLNGAFPPARRGWAIGIFGSVTGLAAVSGPILGGVVTQGLGWQWIFWINVPIALGAIPLVLARLTEATGPGGTVDVPGLVLITAAALGLVWGLVRGNSVGWGSAETVGAFAAGAAAALAFVAREQRAAAPMLPLRLFRSPAFSAGNAAIFLINASISGAVFLMPQFQQVVADQRPLGAGLRLLPWGIAPFLIAPRAGALADRIGERTLVVTGALLQAGGMAWIAAAVRPASSYPALIAPMTLVGVGFAVSIPAVTRAVTSTAPLSDIGKASGAFSTMRQLGGAFGVAIAGPRSPPTAATQHRAHSATGPLRAFAAAAGIALAGAVVAVLLPRRASRAPAAPPRAATGAAPEPADSTR